MVRDQQKANRMNCRRFGLMNFMLSKEVTTQEDEKNGVWVDGGTLRRFMSCEDTMDDILSSPDKPILIVKDHICEHGKGIHPKDAHKGKWLSKQCFEVYLSLLKAEKQLRLEGSGKDSENCSQTLCDVLVTKSNLRCITCEKEYKTSLQEKVDKINLLMKLYCDLAPSIDNIDIQNESNEEVFAVYRPFTTALRKFALKFMKELARTGSRSTIDSIDANEAHIFEAGIGGIEMKKLMPWLTNEVEETSGSFIDPTVNSKITCKCLS